MGPSGRGMRELAIASTRLASTAISASCGTPADRMMDAVAGRQYAIAYTSMRYQRTASGRKYSAPGPRPHTVRRLSDPLETIQNRSYRLFHARSISKPKRQPAQRSTRSLRIFAFRSLAARAGTRTERRMPSAHA